MTKRKRMTSKSLGLFGRLQPPCVGFASEIANGYVLPPYNAMSLAVRNMNIVLSEISALRSRAMSQSSGKSEGGIRDDSRKVLSFPVELNSIVE